MNAPAISRPTADTTGGIADHDDLVVAMARVMDDPRSAVRFSTLYLAARRCGMPGDEADIRRWSERRLASYRTLMADASVPTAAKVLSAMVRVRLAGGSL